MQYRGWYTTKDHLSELSKIRDSTPWYKRLIQRYNIPVGFPYVLQAGSQIVAPCISVVSLSIHEQVLSMVSLENQAEGMPTAKPVNFRSDISRSISIKDIAQQELIPWKSPVFGWSKRNWLSITLLSGETLLIGVNEMPKQLNDAKTTKLSDALNAL